MKCPLCGSGEWEEIDGKTGAQLHELWNEIGIRLPWETFGGIAPDTRVVLHQCSTCQYEFFDPQYAGNGEFYKALEHPEYYCPHRPEFDRTRQFATAYGLRRVLDVGCGAGAFLNSIRQGGLETHGLELNDAAAARAEEQGHKIHRKLLHEIDLSEAGGQFDLITLFQVLEHVTDPVSVLKNAGRLLSPNGWISVSVPSSEGILRMCPDDPHQWPPHHVSRWRLVDLERLGRAAGLMLDRSGGDPLFASDVRLFLNLQHRLAKCAGKKTLPLMGLLICTCAWVYRNAGLKRVLSESGVSAYGYYRFS